MTRNGAPRPISAGYLAGPNEFRTYFDRPLTAGPVNQFNWLFWLTNQRYDMVGTSAVANYVVGTPGAFPVPSPGPDRVQYLPPPFDVLAIDGFPAEAFTFPF